MYFPLTTKEVLNATLTANLFVSSYVGTITTLQLEASKNGSYSLSTLSINNETRDNPSWLLRDPNNNILFSANEYLPATNVSGSITAFKIGDGGNLTSLYKQSVPNGPVNLVLFNGGRAMAAAHYGGSALSTYTINDNGTLTDLQTLNFTMSAPGPDPIRQNAPHPHEVLLDPTENFLVVPDLGADLVRIFPIDRHTSLISESTPLTAAPKSGPRHGAFHVTSSNQTYFYLNTELASTITAYEVMYMNMSDSTGKNKSMMFTQLGSPTSIYGNTTLPAGSLPAAAECLLTPDGRFVLTSSRNLTTLVDPPADTLQTWSITPNNTLSFTQLFSAGGDFPRQFSINKAGDLVAVGLQESGKVVIIARDIHTGLFTEQVAEIAIGTYYNTNDADGQVTSVVWDEC